MNARVDLEAAAHDRVHAAPTAAAQLDAAATPCVGYRATTAFGTWHLRLRVDAAAPAVCSAAAAAQALLQADDLLLALDTWCVESGLDTLAWRWAPDDVDGDLDPIGATARWCAHVATPERGGDAHRAHASVDPIVADNSTSITAPWPALRRLGVMPLALRAGLEWQDAWAVCVLDRFALDDDDAARLESGGAVVLAASLESPWRGALRAMGEDEHAGLALDLAAVEGGAALIATPTTTARSPSWVAARERHDDHARAGAQWEVRSWHPLRVPVPVLCGWVQPDAPWPRALFTQIELAPCGVRGERPRPSMPGQLMPWGHGAAILLGRG